jgi:hypothetical protein
LESRCQFQKTAREQKKRVAIFVSRGDAANEKGSDMTANIEEINEALGFIWSVAALDKFKPGSPKEEQKILATIITEARRLLERYPALREKLGGSDVFDLLDAELRNIPEISVEQRLDVSDAGFCPVCHARNGYAKSMSGDYWFYCVTHRKRWHSGVLGDPDFRDDPVWAQINLLTFNVVEGWRPGNQPVLEKVSAANIVRIDRQPYSASFVDADLDGSEIPF